MAAPIAIGAVVRLASRKNAQMAESVDALVSNTNNFTVVPVRPRLWVLLKLQNFWSFFYFRPMASVYILYSKKLDRFYVGSCKDLSFRIDQHLKKEFAESFTTSAEDWELYLSIDELTYEQARLIEVHLKKMKSKTYVQNLLKYPEIIERLKVKYS